MPVVARSHFTFRGNRRRLIREAQKVLNRLIADNDKYGLSGLLQSSDIATHVTPILNILATDALGRLFY